MRHLRAVMSHPQRMRQAITTTGDLLKANPEVVQASPIRVGDLERTMWIKISEQHHAALRGRIEALHSNFLGYFHHNDQIRLLHELRMKLGGEVIIKREELLSRHRSRIGMSRFPGSRIKTGGANRQRSSILAD